MLRLKLLPITLLSQLQVVLWIILLFQLQLMQKVINGLEPEKGVSKFDGTNWTTYTTADGLADNAVYAIAIDAQGNKWFGTTGWSFKI